jgi:hypothetical protein
MAAMAPRYLAGECVHSPRRGRIGEDDCGRIAVTPTAIIAGQRPGLKHPAFNLRHIRQP